MTDPTSGEVDIKSCRDEEVLSKLLTQTDDFDKKKLIRARLKVLHEEHAKAYEEKKKSHATVDPVAMRAKQAEEAKARQMKGFQEMAKQSAGAVHKDDSVKARAEQAQKDKEAELRNYQELAKTPGAGAVQGSSERERVRRMETEAAAESKARQLRQFDQMAKHVDSPGTIVANEVRKYLSTQSLRPHLEELQLHGLPWKKLAEEPQITFCTNPKHPGRPRAVGSQPGGGRPKSAMSAFKAMDNANNPEAAKAAPAYLQAGSRQPAARGGVTRNPSQIKQMLLEWCQAATKNYKDKGVCVTNFSSSWSDGLAFCALIHNFHPDSFNFDELKASERRKNFQLAFDTAE
uniref:Calponin-homology (CH) domain-containing protein n=1 Tax=Macrostomum lignano TaxID=282301 RepID=A0A1I8IJV8_9PLAT